MDLLDAYYLNQGQVDISETQLARAQNNVQICPIVYGYNIDVGRLGVISDSDRDLFRDWIRENVDKRYEGPTVIDYEDPFGPLLRNPNATNEEWRHAMRTYVWLLHEANRIRPRAKWGHWGRPNWYQGQSWWPNRLDLAPMLRCQGSIHPSTYDYRRGQPDTSLDEICQYALARAEDDVKVYAWLSVRSFGDSGYPILTESEFGDNVGTVIGASYGGRNVDGLIVWDAWSFQGTDNLDLLWANRLAQVRSLIGPSELPETV